MVYNKYIIYLLLSVTLSLVWMIISRKIYNYNKKFPIVFGICLYPLFGWIIGLFTLALIYDLFITLFSKTLTIIILIPLYCILLILVEYVGYHKFGIHNLNTPGNPLFSFIDAMHGPAWIKIAYFVMGILMILLLVILF